jgi:hypothetical protein
MFTETLPSNGFITNTAAHIFAGLLVAEDIGFKHRRLAMADFIRSTKPAFSSHATYVRNIT